MAENEPNLEPRGICGERARALHCRRIRREIDSRLFAVHAGNILIKIRVMERIEDAAPDDGGLVLRPGTVDLRLGFVIEETADFFLGAEKGREQARDRL